MKTEQEWLACKPLADANMPAWVRAIQEDAKEISLEDFVMAHRYLYYVQGQPVLSDLEYDQLESMALKLLPMSSPLYKPGSDLMESYSSEQIALSTRLK